MATASRAQLMDRSNFVPLKNPLQIKLEYVLIVFCVFSLI